MGRNCSNSIFKIVCIFGTLFPRSSSATGPPPPFTPTLEAISSYRSKHRPVRNLTLCGSCPATPFYYLSQSSFFPYPCKARLGREDNSPIMRAICRVLLLHYASAPLHMLLFANSSRSGVMARGHLALIMLASLMTFNGFVNS